MVNFALKTFKYVIFMVNFLIFTLSVAVAGTAGLILSRINFKGVNILKEHLPEGTLYLLIGVSVVAIVISFFGCCGAVQESPCLLYTYACIVFLLLALQIAAAGLIFAFRKDMEQEFKAALKQAIKDYDHEGRPEYREIDDLQQSLKCCGVENSSDWDVYVRNHSSFPQSCCANINQTQCNVKEIHTAPCWNVLNDQLKSVAQVAGIVALAVASIQLIAVIGSCLLARSFRREYEVV
jgi:hypothetical protein